MKKEVLYVDGYNMIGAWPELVKLKNQDKMADARNRLLHELSNFAKYEGAEVKVVFDAQLVPGVQQQYDHYNLMVIFTKEGETADSYIERTVGEENLLLSNVYVATSDLAEQWMIFQKGASRKSANELYKDVQRAKKNIELDTRMYRLQGVRRHSALKPEDMDRLKDLYREMVDRKD